jgi:hypothetical protein
MRNVLCLSGWLTFALAVRAGVYDDATRWWHLDYDPDHDPDTLNPAQLSDIRDQREWANSSLYPTGIGGEYGGPLWTNAPVACPAGGQAYGLSLHFPQITNGLSQIKPDAIAFSNLRLGGSSTIVTRFLWDGRFFSVSQPDWIYNNSLVWGTSPETACGWMFGIRHNSGHRLGLYVGQADIQLTSATVESNRWYDAAAVLTDNGLGNTDTVELFLWPEGGTLLYGKYTTSAVTNAVGGPGGVIGSESGPQASYVTVTNNANSGKSFKGLLNHLALWNRALTYNEVLEAFCFPQPLVQIGLDNNSSAELRPEPETDAVFNAGDPWHTMPRAVTATRPSVTLNVPLTAVQTNCNYLFHLKTHLSDGSQSAKLLLAVNGQANPAREALRAYPGQDLFWPVSRERLAAGTNAFTLTYAGGPATWITFDFMELGGAWQIGIEDNQAGTDFSQEHPTNRVYWVTDTNWKHLARAVTYGQTNIVIHFNLSSQMVERTAFTYTTRIVQQGYGSGTQPLPPYPFSIGMNDRVVYQSETGVPDSTLIHIPFSPGDLRAGDNAINLMFNSSNGWLQFDFHRLNTAPWVLPNLTGTLFHAR